MKKLRRNMDKWFDKLDKRWQSLPVCRQHKFTLYFFAGYLMLTAGVIFKVWHDTAKSDNDMIMQHIGNPMLKTKESPAKPQDTLSIIPKDKTYERK